MSGFGRAYESSSVIDKETAQEYYQVRLTRHSPGGQVRSGMVMATRFTPGYLHPQGAPAGYLLRCRLVHRRLSIAKPLRGSHVHRC
jgi:hypothetical protein